MTTSFLQRLRSDATDSAVLILKTGCGSSFEFGPETNMAAFGDKVRASWITYWRLLIALVVAFVSIVFYTNMQ